MQHPGRTKSNPSEKRREKGISDGQKGGSTKKTEEMLYGKHYYNSNI